MNVKRGARWIQAACFAIGICLLTYPAVIFVYGKGYQMYLAFVFHPEVPVPSKAVHASSVAAGMPIAKLEIPRLKFSVVVLEGIADSILKRGVGHVPETALPGKPGNVGIAAHRDTFFRSLKDIRDGDLIRLRTYDGVFDYRVEWTRVVKPAAVDVLDVTDAPSLTLVTCYPFYYVGSAPDRFIVRARQLLDQYEADFSLDETPPGRSVDTVAVVRLP